MPHPAARGRPVPPAPGPAPSLAPRGRRRGGRGRAGGRGDDLPPGPVDARGPRPRLTPWQATVACLARSFDFAGRARRDEYWGFAAVLSGVLAIDLAVEALVPTGLPFGAVAAALALLAAPASLAAGWRRLHDVDRPGWYSVLHLVAFAGLALGVAAVAYATGEAAGPARAAGRLPLAVTLSPLVAAILVWGLVLRWLVRPTWPRNNRWGRTPNV